MSPTRQVVGLVVLLAVTFAAAGIGSIATAPNIPGWYATLTKPSWNPPSWIFGPVWTTLYISMAVAAWLVWRQGGLWQWALALFAVQLALNAAWSWLFFGLHLPGAAFAEIVALFAAILATTIAFWSRSLVAGILMVPYLAWVSFASVLNGAYDYRTFVFRSANPMDFHNVPCVAQLQAHAPEVFRDEDGDWFIASVEWPKRGLSIAPLA
jgi:tryptophan-rich sensory protein